MPLLQLARGSQAERTTDGVVGAVLKISKVMPLAALLDTYGRGRDLGAVDKPGVDNDGLRKRKKRRRGLRL